MFALPESSVSPGKGEGKWREIEIHTPASEGPVLKSPGIPPLIHSVVRTFPQHLHWARHCDRCWESGHEQNRQKFLSCGADVLAVGR